jgi:SMI1 / KNR4 family (SUKH-1)
VKACLSRTARTRNDVVEPAPARPRKIVDMTFLEKDDLFSKFRGNPPATAAEIERFEEEVGLKLPKDYAAFLQRSNGGEGFIGPNAYVIFWRLGELAKMNKAYQVEEYSPGFFTFGSDGGGEAYAFDARTSAMPIVSIPFVGMELSLARMMTPSFDGFLEALSQA